MSKKGDNIYYRKDGRWEGRYIKGRKIDGTIRYGYVYRKTKKETKRMLDMYNTFYNPKIVQQPEVEMTFSEWLPIWFRSLEYQVKATTYSNYQYKLRKYITPFFKHKKVHEITEEILYSYLDELKTLNLSTSSIHSIFTLFKQCFKSACEQIACDYSFLRKVKLPNRTWGKVRALSLSEQKKFTTALKKEPLAKSLPTLLSLHTGMRIGEISALEWADVNFEKKVIYVSKTCQRIQTKDSQKPKTIIHVDLAKSKSAVRLIPMTPFILKKMREHKKNSAQSRWVFSIKNGLCEPRLLTRYFHSLREKVGLSIHFHQLRHTFATRCLEALADIPTVSALLGHRSTQLTLDTYSDVFIEQRVQTITKVGKYIS